MTCSYIVHLKVSIASPQIDSQIQNTETCGWCKLSDMNQKIDLDGLTLEKSDSGALVVTHHKTNTTAELSAASLVRWLMRQLRALF